MLVLDTGRVWVYGDLVVDVGAWEVTLLHSRVNLTKTEFLVLLALASRPRRVVTAEQLTQDVWGGHWYGDDGNIAVHISKLRHKLGESGLAPRYIRTVRGVGYLFDPSPEDGGDHSGGSADFEAFASLPGAVEVRTDAELMVREIIPADTPVLGWHPAQIVGRYLPVVDDPRWQDQRTAREGVAFLAATGVREWTARQRVRRADGSTGSAELMTRLVVGRDDSVREVRFVVVEVRDEPGGGIAAMA
ncbi:MAG: winged helix-turn-helix domain-containing protein [Candidatus Nanopelagicales bacterium]